jgi:hypothetical protein
MTLVNQAANGVNRYIFVSSLLTLCAFILFIPNLTYAEKLDVEWIATEIARIHNENAKMMLDDMTVSSTAKAVGRNVIIKNVQRFKRGRAQKPSATFLGDNVAWEKTTSS